MKSNKIKTLLVVLGITGVALSINVLSNPPTMIECRHNGVAYGVASMYGGSCPTEHSQINLNPEYHQNKRTPEDCILTEHEEDLFN